MTFFFLKADHENCVRTIQLIQEYSKASGQMVNMVKSCVVFTENVTMKRSKGYHLFREKTRCEAMSYVRDRVVKRLSNWK